MGTSAIYIDSSLSNGKRGLTKKVHAFLI